MDTIAIRNIRARAVIGTLPSERVRKQPVIADILLHADLAKASASDTLADTLDYSHVTEEVLRHIASSRYQLLERLAGSLAELCLRQQGVRSVEVTLTKPEALGAKATVSVTVRRVAGTSRRRSKAVINP